MPLRRATNRLKSLGKRLGFRADWYLIALGAAIGTVTAAGAVGFKWLLDRGGELGVDIQISLAVWALPLLPMAGALVTGLLVYFLAREARGHGVPEVMDALYRKKAVIRPRVAIVKSLASACTIGSGGSAGAEGPIVQIGSAIGSGFSQMLGVPRDQAATLLGCGAAAGIASVFNAPIAGVFFVLEILLRDFSLRTFTPIVVASVFSTATTQAILGRNEAIFAVSDQLTTYEFSFPEFPSYLVLGLIAGLVAVAFLRMLYYTEDLFDEKVKLHGIMKPVIGALLLGVMGIAFLFINQASGITAEVPPFFGNGYETIRGLLDPASFAAAEVAQNVAAGAGGAPGLGEGAAGSEVPAAPALVFSTALWMLGLVVLCKAMATCFTLGSGGSGGIFAPALFLGAGTGAFFGVVLERVGLIPVDGSPAAYALVGMAAVVAGATHAPLTAILILFELTRDVYVLLPIMLAAVVAVVVAQYFMRDSIYTLKLRRRGVLLGTMSDLTLLRRIVAGDVQPGPFIAVYPEDPLTRLLELRDRYRITDFTICDHDNNYLGMVTSADLRTAIVESEAIPYLLVEELLRRDVPVVHPEETLDTVLEKFGKHEVNSLALIDPNTASGKKVVGLITRARLMARYQESLTESQRGVWDQNEGE